MATDSNADLNIPDPEAPFILELRHENVKSNGDFTPTAAVLVTDALRHSGLQQALLPENFQTLLLVLSCVTAKGNFIATPQLLAPVAGVSSGHMLARLRQLTRLSWRNEPLLSEQETGAGMLFFSPGRQLLEIRRSLVFPATERPGTALQIPEVVQKQNAQPQRHKSSSREAVIAYSRAKYSRPRAEVEAQIERFLRGESEPTTPEEAAHLQVRRRLMDYGVTGDQADRLLENHAIEAIEQQLAWLPHRHARNPAGLLISAIEGNYEPPLAIRVAKSLDTPGSANAEDEDATLDGQSGLKVEASQVPLAPHPKLAVQLPVPRAEMNEGEGELGL